MGKKNKKRALRKQQKQARKNINLAKRLIEWGLLNNSAHAINVSGQILQTAAHRMQSPQSASPVLENLAVPFPEPSQSQAAPDNLPSVAADKEFASATDSGMVARGAAPSARQTSRGQWEGSIDKGDILTLDPHPTFAKKSRAVVQVEADDDDARLFVFWRQINTEHDVDDYATGFGNVTAKWKTGMNTTEWEVRIQNKNGPDAMAVKVTSNAS